MSYISEFEELLAQYKRMEPESVGTDEGRQETETKPLTRRETVSLQSYVQSHTIGQEDAILTFMKALNREAVIGQHLRILIGGKEGTGRHHLLKTAAEGKDIPLEYAVLDCSRYQIAEEETNFLQDLYMAISNGSWIVFDGIENIGSYFIPMLNEALRERQITLTKRYQFDEGRLIDMSGILTQKAINKLSFDEHTILMITGKSGGDLTDKFGKQFMENFDTIVSVKPPTYEEVKELIEKFLEDLCDRVNEVDDFSAYYDDSLADYLFKIYTGNAKDTLQILDKLYQKAMYLKFKVLDVNEIQFLYDGDIKGKTDKGFVRVKVDSNGDHLAQAKKELEQVVGLEEVKKYISSLEANVNMQQQRRAKGLKTVKPNLHMIFTGNPGTGKTTMARILAKTLKGLGVLSSGHCVEVSRVDLVSKYLGGTAPMTQQVIRSAMGGVLFIDEAYSLYRGSEGTDYGLEAIDTLVKAMEDFRDDFVVVLAGYSKEMETFLTANSGLRSRFPNQVEFRDYTAPELMAITVGMAKEKDYTISDDCHIPIMLYYEKMQEREGGTAGNGRMARNLLEEAILRQSARCMGDEGADMSLLTLEDFNLSI